MASTDALPIPRKNVAFRVTFPILDADGDLVTGAGSLDSEISKDGGTFTDCTNEATEIATSSGMYYLDLTSTEMNADCVAIIVKSASGKTTPIVLYPEELGDMRANVGQWNGTAIPSEHTAGYPIVTVKDGTGTGEINTNAGAIAVVDLVTLVTTATTLTNLPAITAGWLTAAGIDADAITAAKLAADVTTELQAGLATAANLATVAGYIDTEVASILAAVDTEIATIITNIGNLPTAAGIADAVWEEDLSDHASTVGSVAEALNAAGAAGDPWTTALPGAYGVGSAGKIIGDNIDATISSRASQTSLDTVDDFLDTEIAAIKAKTDQLTFTNANTINAAVLAVADLADAVGTKIAAIILRLTMASVEAHASGEAVNLSSLYGLVQQAQESAVSAGTLTVKKTDGTTTLGTKTVTSDSGAEPITGVS